MNNDNPSSDVGEHSQPDERRNPPERNPQAVADNPSASTSNPNKRKKKWQKDAGQDDKQPKINKFFNRRNSDAPISSEKRTPSDQFSKTQGPRDNPPQTLKASSSNGSQTRPAQSPMANIQTGDNSKLKKITKWPHLGVRRVNMITVKENPMFAKYATKTPEDMKKLIEALVNSVNASMEPLDFAWGLINRRNYLSRCRASEDMAFDVMAFIGPGKSNDDFLSHITERRHPIKTNTRIVFYYRRDEIFFLPTGQSYWLLDWCADTDFPHRIIRRLFDEKVNAHKYKPLFSNVNSVEVAYKMPEELCYLQPQFQSKLVCNLRKESYSSLHLSVRRKLETKKGKSILATAGVTFVKLAANLDKLDYCEVMHFYSQICKGGETDLDKDYHDNYFIKVKKYLREKLERHMLESLKLKSTPVHQLNMPSCSDSESPADNEHLNSLPMNSSTSCSNTDTDSTGENDSDTSMDDDIPREPIGSAFRADDTHVTDDVADRPGERVTVTTLSVYAFETPPPTQENTEYRSFMHSQPACTPSTVTGRVDEAVSDRIEDDPLQRTQDAQTEAENDFEFDVLDESVGPLTSFKLFYENVQLATAFAEIPTLAEILEKICSKIRGWHCISHHEFDQRLKRFYVSYQDDGETKPKVPIFRCIQGSQYYQGTLYTRIYGEWFMVSKRFNERVHDAFTKILSHRLISKEQCKNALLPNKWFSKTQEDNLRTVSKLKSRTTENQHDALQINDGKKDKEGKNLFEKTYNSSYKYIQNPDRFYIFGDCVLFRKDIEVFDLMMVSDECQAYIYQVKKDFKGTRMALQQLESAKDFIDTIGFKCKDFQKFFESLKNRLPSLQNYFEKSNNADPTNFWQKLKNSTYVLAVHQQKYRHVFTKEFELAVAANRKSVGDFKGTNSLLAKIVKQALVDQGFLNSKCYPTEKFKDSQGTIRVSPTKQLKRGFSWKYASLYHLSFSSKFSILRTNARLGDKFRICEILADDDKKINATNWNQKFHLVAAIATMKDPTNRRILQGMYCDSVPEDLHKLEPKLTLTVDCSNSGNPLEEEEEVDQANRPE